MSVYLRPCKLSWILITLPPLRHNKQRRKKRRLFLWERRQERRESSFLHKIFILEKVEESERRLIPTLVSASH